MVQRLFRCPCAVKVGKEWAITIEEGSALHNAATIAGLMLTAEAMVAEMPKEEKAPMPGAGIDQLM